ncbi:non-ribosomal peptide synthase domain TIGR01720/amino acid adenylation domain-containing protein [Thermoactinomyces sp. DSM 45891]|uniref:non-ribosomal peptide synthetase n=1 Tax=Thermoactinomyces sp. DSM 45891 TaxID=1761907 RepID=UPI0009213E1D|nr:non-ribosomal peptide synthetase [Thermoactinomyces sp. DSM 45891]SFX17711.1 non-ribosomal peptide synthase domain TIGR01720/amino acid adenylation domain-containing protein [Thermoactinomyces sp. DSM 45891]
MFQEGNRFPLTHPQKRIWYIEKLISDSPMHHICGTAELKGEINLPHLEETVLRFLKKHDSFHLHFFEENEEVYQTVSECTLDKIDFFDFSQGDNPSISLDQWIRKEIEKPFSLIGNDLFYLAIYRKSESCYGLFVKVHHLIFDGWSVQLLAKQICEMYEGVEEEHKAGSYIDYIGKEQRYLQSERLIKNKEFWMTKFETLPELLFAENQDGYEGKRKSFVMDPSFSAKMKGLSKKYQCSLNEWYIMLVQIYLHKIVGRRDIVIGTPVYNRSGKNEKETIGMFTSTMPLRCEIDVESSVTEYLKAVKREIRQCYMHQKYPYNLLANDLQLKKHGYDSLFQLAVNYYNFQANNQLFDPEEIHNGHQLFPMQIVVKDWSEEGSLQLDFDYKTSMFTDKYVEQMNARIIYLAEQIFQNPDVSIGNLTLLSDAEMKELVYDFNDTDADYPKEKTVTERFEEQVQRIPNHVAVSCRDESLTYAELNGKANQLARSLVKCGIGRGDIVGIFADHSLDLPVAILGILKTGAAYVPIDVKTATSRMEEILLDSEASSLLTNREVPKDMSFTGPVMNFQDPYWYTGDSSNLDVKYSPNDLVYMIYTSGSTGKPKGVMIEHRGLMNYVWWAQKMYVRDVHDSFALYSSLAFDLTVTSIFTPLIGGNQIRVYPENDDNFVLYDILEDNRVSIIKLTPAHLSLLQGQTFPNSTVKRLIVGGEELKGSLAQRIQEAFHGKIEILNEYGPTETVVGCMIHRFNPSTDTKATVPIGIPADNVQIYLLDEKLKPVPKGCIGEMYISGDGVARGYWNRPDLTDQCFMDNPFKTDKKMYKTGDLAKCLDHGLIEYIGRKDQQVKLRGYRIELSEIEYRLMKLPYVKEAVVIDRISSTGQKQLYAYLIKTMDEDISALTIKKDLANVLPTYMIPAYFLFIDQIPLTKNGKVDRNQLPVEEPSVIEIDPDQVVDDRELQVLMVLQEILQMDSVHLQDDFYQLGGDSIKAIQIASKLKQVGLKIRAKDILAHSAIHEMMACVEVDRNEQSIEQGIAEGVIPLSPIASWFFSQSFQEDHHWNQSVLLNLNERVEIDQIEAVMDVLIRQHDTLRINVNREAGMMFYNPAHLERPFQLTKFDLSHLSYESQQVEMEQLGLKLKSTMDLEQDLLIDACTFDLGKQGKRLLLTAHHLIIDAVSWRILLGDMVQLLENPNRSDDSLTKTHSYQYWVNELNSYVARLTEDDIQYWKLIGKRTSGLSPSAVQREEAQGVFTLQDRLNEEETRALLTSANEAFHTESVELLISSLALAIKEHTNQSRVCIEMEGHGREEFTHGLDLSRTVGWFTSMYPVLLEVEDEAFSTQMKSMKEQIRKVPNKGLDYLILKYMSDRLQDGDEPLVRFNYLGDFDATAYPKFFTFASESSGSETGKNHLTAVMDITAMIMNQELQLSITYNESSFPTEMITSFMKQWIHHLRRIIEQCCNQEQTQFTPSDFETVNLSQEELDLLTGI